LGTLRGSTETSNTSERSGFSSACTTSHRASESANAHSARPKSTCAKSGIWLRRAAPEGACYEPERWQARATGRRLVDDLQHLAQFLLVEIAHHAAVVRDRNLPGLL